MPQINPSQSHSKAGKVAQLEFSFYAEQQNAVASGQFLPLIYDRRVI